MLGKGEALQELGGHSHWVWRAQYNPFHSQLLASSSSDSLVLLWHTPHLAQATDASGTTPRSAAHTPGRYTPAPPPAGRPVPMLPVFGHTAPVDCC